MSTPRFIVRSGADIGRMIAEARRERGFTQAKLASKVRMDRTYLARLEAGRSTIQIERVLALLRELGVTITATLQTRDGDHA